MARATITLQFNGVLVGSTFLIWIFCHRYWVYISAQIGYLNLSSEVSPRPVDSYRLEEARMGGKSSSPPTANFPPQRLEKLAAARKVSRG